MSKIMMTVFTETRIHLSIRSQRIVCLWEHEWSCIRLETDWFPTWERAMQEARTIGNSIAPGLGDVIEEQHEIQRDGTR
jgi:hypothetical protein